MLNIFTKSPEEEKKEKVESPKVESPSSSVVKVHESGSVPVEGEDAGLSKEVRYEAPELDVSRPESGVDYMKSLYTSPEDEERFLKSSLNKRRLLAITDVLRHIGNLYNVSKGAVPQQFNSPVDDEKNEYLREKSLRDANNEKYYSYKRMKDNQDAAQARWERDYALKLGEMQRKGDATAAQIQAAKDKLAELKRHNAEIEDANAKKLKIAEDDAKDKAHHRKELESIGWANASTNRIGKTYSFTDADGNVHTYTNTKEYDAGVRHYAKKAGISTDVVVKSKGMGNIPEYKTRERGTDELAGEMERRAALRKSGKPVKTTSNQFGATRHGSGTNTSTGTTKAVKKNKFRVKKG